MFFQTLLICMLADGTRWVDGSTQAIGSCSFEQPDREQSDNGLCGYSNCADEGEDFFLWTMENGAGGHYMNVNTEEHVARQKARLCSPKIQQQDTHCFSFKYHMEGGGAGNHSSAASLLNVYVLDSDTADDPFPVWQTSTKEGRSGWTTVQLALNPRDYKVMFEAYVLEASPGVIAVDSMKVNNEPCDSAPHFLRVGNKEVNAQQNVTMQCLLWGHNMVEMDEKRDGKTVVVMQDANGDEFESNERKIFDDHLSVMFKFPDATTETAGKYRCVSRNATEVGISNFAKVTVKTPPVPQQPPDVKVLGSTHLEINLNSDSFAGDGPVVRTILSYRPVSGLWSDVHEINELTYHLWHLKPDTEYELTVTLVRPGVGGTGNPGPPLITKTNCGVPLRPVQNVQTTSTASDIEVSWQAPDFSIVQCHFHSYVIKYRKIPPKDSNSGSDVEYETMTVKNGNVTVIPNLQPYTKYAVKVELTNSEGSAETEEYSVSTGEGVPGPIPAGSFVVTAANETSITLSWEKPEVTNGVLIRYEVMFRGLSSFQPDFTPQEDNGLFQIRADDTSVTLNTLHPGTNYTLSIHAQTKVGAGPAVEITASTKIAPPKMGIYPEPTPDDGMSSTTIEIDILPAQANGGPVSNYYIIIEELPSQDKEKEPESKGNSGRSKSGSRSNRRKKKNKKREKRSLVEIHRFRRQIVVATDDNNGLCHSNPISYEDSKKQNKTFYFGGRLSPDAVKEGVKFIVGEGIDSGGFSNPPLDPNKKYNIYVRVDSNVGDDTRVNCALVAIKASVPPPPPTTQQPVILTTRPLLVGSVSNELARSSPGVIPNNSDGENNGKAGQSDDNDKVLLYASVGGGIVGIVILIVVIAFIIFKFRRRNGKAKQKEEVVNPFEVRMMMADMSSGGIGHSMTRSTGSPDRQALMMPDVLGQNDIDYLDKSGDPGGSRVLGTYGSPATPIADDRPALRVDDFHIHVNDMKRQNNYGFHDEFTSFREGQTASWEIGKRNENRTKNRYGNIMAYDHSRVVLIPPKGQEEQMSSDYINANYISGYKNPSMYIAAQAPAAETVSDFWLMIWQEKCSVIVMVTNLVELGKRKCHKYWPEESEQHGTIKISLTDTEVLCDYTIRTFVVQQVDDYNVREVKQFHFTAWPDHGVPTRPTNILSFIRRVKGYEPSGEGPTIVHCSAGSGRTGCFIVIDMMLDMARDEGVVDIYNSVQDLRTRRVNMVQTEEQYVFIHESVLEALLCGDTLVSAPDLRQHYDTQITVDPLTQIAPVQEEFETLHLMTPKLSEEECSVARLPRNRPKNRFMDVLPSDRQLPYLVTPDPLDPESNYINAVFADSYSTRNAFLVTQMPLPNTVIDFWRLVYDYNCTSIIMMNDVSEHDQSCREYWTDGGSAMFGPFTVELLRKEDEVDVITRLFKLQNTNKPSEGFRIVQQFQLTNWPAAQPVPFTRNAVLRVIQLVTKWQAECASSGDGRMLVHCVAGAGRSGTFVACYNMCIQLRQEYAVDVFNIVQRLRNVRPQLVETLEQYRFCYEVGWDFADQ